MSDKRLTPTALQLLKDLHDTLEAMDDEEAVPLGLLLEWYKEQCNEAR